MSAFIFSISLTDTAHAAIQPTYAGTCTVDTAGNPGVSNDLTDSFPNISSSAATNGQNASALGTTYSTFESRYFGVSPKSDSSDVGFIYTEMMYWSQNNKSSNDLILDWNDTTGAWEALADDGTTTISIFPISATKDGIPIAICLLYTSPSPRDKRQSRMPSSA